MDSWVIWNLWSKKYLEEIFQTKSAALEKANQLNEQAGPNYKPIFAVVPKTRFYDERQDR